MLREPSILIAHRLYALLIRLCPAGRVMDPSEMIGVFEQALRAELAAKGWTGFCRFCLGAYADTLAFAALEWASIARQRQETSRLSSGQARLGRSPMESTTMSIASFPTQARFGYRSLRKTPFVALVAMSTLALAVGLAAVTLSVVYGTTLRALPFAGGDRIMSVGLASVSGDRRLQFEALELRDFQDRQSSFESLEGYFQRRVTLQNDEGQARSLNAGVVTANALSHLGTAPFLGRTFVNGEDFTDSIQHVVLSHKVWDRSFGSRYDIVGKTARVDGRALEVIGVMPEGFRFPAREDLWLPMDFKMPVEDRGSGRSFRVFGRLKQGVSRSEAEAEARLIAGGISRENPDFHPPLTARVTPFVQAHLPSGLDSLLRILLAAVVGILLIAGANVVNLQLARAVVRSRETTIRTALGAGRGEITAQFLVESLLLSIPGALGGIALAAIGTVWVQNTSARFSLPYWAEVRLDPPVLLTTVACSILLAVGVGLFSAWQGSRSGSAAIQGLGRGSGGERAGRVGRVLVTAQIAISCALLVGAGLLMKSLLHARTLDLGFNAEQVMMAEVRLPKLNYRSPESRADAFLSFLDEVSNLPGVEGASWVRSPPGTGPTFSWTFQVEGAEPAEGSGSAVADGVPISHGYFDVLGIPVLRGRDFAARESRFGHAPAVIVNETLATRHLGAEPVGRRLRLSDDPDEPWLTVVGVVADSYIGSSSGGIGLSASKREQIFVSWSIGPYSRATLLLRSAAQDPLTLAPQARELLAEVAPGVSLDEVAHLGRVIDDTTWAFGLFGSLFGVFGSVALILSTLGLYGVSAFVVNRRRQEIGVRMALGATPSAVIRWVLGGATRQLMVGAVAGLLLGYWLAQSIRALLFEVGAADPIVYGAVASALMLTGLCAAFLSARKVGRIAPSEVLGS